MAKSAEREKMGIYVDSCKLRKTLKRAQFVMTKGDRMIYGTPALIMTGIIIAFFVLAFDTKRYKIHFITIMIAVFEVLKVDLRAMIEDNVFKNSGKEGCGISAEAYGREIFELVARIDIGMSKWRESCEGKIPNDKVKYSSDSH